MNQQYGPGFEPDNLTSASATSRMALEDAERALKEDG